MLLFTWSWKIERNQNACNDYITKLTTYKWEYTVKVYQILQELMYYSLWYLFSCFQVVYNRHVKNIPVVSYK